MFRTELHPRKSEQYINHTTPIVTIGSCFSDQIGAYFIKNKFKITSNPFGTVYNPISICKLLQLTIDSRYPKQNTYLTHQHLHANYDFHSSFSSYDQSEITTSIESAIQQTHEKLKVAQYLIITLGTAFVYERVDNNEIVANCHKVPAKAFRKRLLSETEITHSICDLKDRLSSLNPDLKIILTVSPVRHIKDTLELNSVSKSLLRIACNQLVNQYDSIHYFPSYELLLDDLRDYRFYKADMIHPNEVAEDYIWEKFQETYFDKNTITLLKEWKKLSAAIGHRPFNAESDEHQKFLKETISKLKKIKDKLNIDQEIVSLENQLTK